MKKVLCLLSIAVIASGCTSLQTPPTTTIDHLATAGSLHCKTNEICPNVVVEWDKQQKDQLKVDVALTSTYQYYDITGITFLVDGKSFNYLPTEKTQQKYINKLIPKRSSNTFVLPSLFLYELRNAKNVALSIETDKGVIQRSVYTPTQSSTLFQNFTQLIASLPKQQPQ
ncbi:hypothetical protein [Acinetobacter sp. NIPH 2699]|uniref:hypothetical protein n=1 Tax=Acinetobacter sp. NIPH 2699 TaxID=2923433 RepID=UPI001F4A6F21|nr:hypothetical protein [Acinetobacter sp. NIPH 2699]MCH7336853.1 hypothetical protein [Acinetobacter sp. NIPH 2699]